MQGEKRATDPWGTQPCGLPREPEAREANRKGGQTVRENQARLVTDSRVTGWRMRRKQRPRCAGCAVTRNGAKS